MSSDLRTGGRPGRATVRLLGDPEVTVAGAPVTDLGVEALQTMVLIALSGEEGIEAWRLRDLLPSRGQGLVVTPPALHQRIRKLKKLGVPIPDLKRPASGYRLDRDLVDSIDTEEFVQGVVALSDPAPPADLDRLMALWRADPWAWPHAVGESLWDEVRDALDSLIDRLIRLDVDVRSQLNGLIRFARVFPNDRRLDQLRHTARRRPRLLVVEDQVMDDLESILRSEFEVQPVRTIEDWNEACDSLAVDGALIDRHLTPDLADDLGTTKVADYLRRYTEIPAALMSVAPPPSYKGMTRIRQKYRLLEVVHKGRDQRLNESELLEAARLLVGVDESSRHARLVLWIESDLYHVGDESAFHPHRPHARQRAADCRREAETLLDRIRGLAITQAEAEVTEFHLRWGPQSSAATS